MLHHLFSFLFLGFSIAAISQNKVYYVSAMGNDASDGLTTTTAWKSISKANMVDLEPGDKLLFEGGKTFNGTLLLNQEDRGLKTSPIVIGSYGTGKALIYGSKGILATNAGGIEIHNLVVKGDGSQFTYVGADSTANDGVHFLINQAGSDIDYILLKNLEVFGFGGTGIVIKADSTEYGFNDVSIMHCVTHDNDHAGIETFGFWPRYSHTNFYVGHCKAYNNSGTFATENHSGSGIVVSGVIGAKVEYCEAFNNGANNRNKGGGPIGIWTYNAKNVIIQFCESQHNKAGLHKDGGGFDIDGGAQNCIIQYCYSHDNEGAGYGMYEFGSPNAYFGNIIRYNISQNDGRKNGFGALSFWAVDAEHKLNDSWVYNNTFFLDTIKMVNGQPSGIEVIGGNMKGLQVVNNIFFTKAGIPLIRTSEPIPTTSILFKNNNYFSTSDPLFLWGNSIYNSLAAWKAAAPGQEMEGTTSLGFATDPLLNNPGGGTTVGVGNGGKLSSMTAYQLKSNSPMIDKGLFISNRGTRDYYGTTITSTQKSDIGAAEYQVQATAPGVLETESALLNKVVIATNQAGFTGTGFGDYINATGDFIEWTLDKPGGGLANIKFRYANGASINRPLKLEVNGQVVKSSISFPPTGAWTKWSLISTSINLISGINKIRLTAIGYSGANIDHLTWSEEVPTSSGLLEAELAVLNKVVKASNQAGFTGTGFGDYINATGDYIEWTLDKPGGGLTALKFRYANGSSADRPLKLEVNGQVVKYTMSFLPTGAWTNWSSASVNANLISGLNKIRLTAIGYSGANMDHLAWSQSTTTISSAFVMQEQELLPADLKVFVTPNPAVDVIKVKVFSSSVLPVELELVDMSGKSQSKYVIKNSFITNTLNIPIAHLPSGIYLIILKQGTQTSTARFIVAKK